MCGGAYCASLPQSFFSLSSQTKATDHKATTMPMRHLFIRVSKRLRRSRYSFTSLSVCFSVGPSVTLLPKGGGIRASSTICISTGPHDMTNSHQILRGGSEENIYRYDHAVSPGENVRPSVRPSTKSFFDLNEIYM